METRNDPVEAFKVYARAETGPAENRLSRLEKYISRLEQAREQATALHRAWSIEAEVLEDMRPPEIGSTVNFLFTETGATPLDKRLRELIQRTDLSVRSATLAALYYLGALEPAQIRDALTAHGYQFGKAVPGNAVRAALWQSSKGGQTKSSGKKHDFASPDARATFERRFSLNGRAA